MTPRHLLADERVPVISRLIVGAHFVWAIIDGMALTFKGIAWLL